MGCFLVVVRPRTGTVAGLKVYRAVALVVSASRRSTRSATSCLVCCIELAARTPGETGMNASHPAVAAQEESRGPRI